MKKSVIKQAVILVVGGKFEIAPTFLKDRAILHPIPKSFAGVIAAGELWEGAMAKARTTGRKDKRGVPVYVQAFLPSAKVRNVKISLPADTGRTVSEFVNSQASAVVSSGQRELKRFLIDHSGIDFEPLGYAKAIVARLRFTYGGKGKVGCSRLMSIADAKSLGCSESVLNRACL